MTPKALLKQTFGYDAFRPQQEEVVNQVLSQNDVFVLMPTGGGKSICYQVPALILPGITIVISPLISLMQDQVETLRGNGVKAAFYNSTQSGAERNQLIQECLAGEIKLLYLSPETYLPAVDSWLRDCTVSLIAIDEAHCVSSWGHDFRPEYTQLGPTRDFLPDAPVIALTATADQLTRKDIIKQLELKNPDVFISSFDRPNIQLTVRGNMKKKEKVKEIFSFIDEHSEDSGIIYCLSRKETEEWAALLQQNGYKALHYHAGMPTADRAQTQQLFITDEVPIICATIAFGMGIDKSNVRWVIHNNLPKNMESYYQEIGRAGRDGLPSNALLYFTAKDIILQNNFIDQGENSIVNRKKLQRMQQFAEATSCRRKILLQYFSETLEEDCGNCDVCLNPPDFFDGTIIAQMALSGIKRTNERVSTTALIKILRGADTADIRNRGFHQLKTYGVGADHSESDWQHFIAQLINLHLVEIDYERYLNLRITSKGLEALYGRSKVKLTQPPARKTKGKKKTKQRPTGTSDNQLLSALKELRLELARKRGVPAYIIFNDATLVEMSISKPQTLEQLSSVQGVGVAKLEQYGNLFLDCISKNNAPSKLDTLTQTYELVLQGLSAAEIARTRGLQTGSIYQHLEQLLKDGKIDDYTPFISEDEIQRVLNTAEIVEEKGKLRPIYEALNETIPYEKIKLALTIHSLKSSS